VEATHLVIDELFFWVILFQHREKIHDVRVLKKKKGFNMQKNMKGRKGHHHQIDRLVSEFKSNRDPRNTRCRTCTIEAKDKGAMAMTRRNSSSREPMRRMRFFHGRHYFLKVGIMVMDRTLRTGCRSRVLFDGVKRCGETRRHASCSHSTFRSTKHKLIRFRWYVGVEGISRECNSVIGAQVQSEVESRNLLASLAIYLPRSWNLGVRATAKKSKRMLFTRWFSSSYPSTIRLCLDCTSANKKLARQTFRYLF